MAISSSSQSPNIVRFERMGFFSCQNDCLMLPIMKLLVKHMLVRLRKNCHKSRFFASSKFRFLACRMSIESVTPFNHLLLCRPLLLLPSIFPSISESALRIRWPKYWNLSISPSKECSGQIYFRKFPRACCAPYRSCRRWGLELHTGHLDNLI